MTWPSFQSTPRYSGMPAIGSIVEVCDCPVVQPREFIEPATLLLFPGSAPRSVITTSFHRNACDWKQSGFEQKKDALGSGTARSAYELTSPELFRSWKPSPFIFLKMRRPP